MRELAARYGSSQDAIVDRAVEELERTLRERTEASSWEAAASDPAFGAEVNEIARNLDEPDRWPA